MTEGQRDINRKLKILKHGTETGTIARHADILVFPGQYFTNGRELMLKKVNPFIFYYF